MPSLWRTPRPPKRPEKDYEGNAERLLAFGTANPSARELKAIRIAKEVRLAQAQGRAPTVQEVQARHSYTPEAAAKFLAAVQRALKPPKKAKARIGAPAPEEATHPVQDGDRILSARDASPTALPLQAILADIRRRFGDEIRLRGEQTTVREGFVYLVVHPSFEGWVKAGMTIDFELRKGTYNVADPLSRFEMPVIAWTPDRRGAEQVLLEALRAVAQEMRGEWARLSLDEATAVFRTLELPIGR